MSDATYENMPRKLYDGGACFVPVCETCGRFVKADSEILVNDWSGLHPGPNCDCSKCGRSRMIFEGFV